MRCLTGVLLVLFAMGLGVMMENSNARYTALATERAVAALPGVGQGWLDTLRLIAGDVRIDTVTPLMAYDDGPSLLGVFEPWHLLVSIRTDMREYFTFQRGVCGMHSFGYLHPVTLATPAAVVAHEFGHRFQFGLWPHGLPGLPGDTVPKYARDFDERFADRFARAMLALRGWDHPDTADVMLNHVVHIRLVQALAR